MCPTGVEPRQRIHRPGTPGRENRGKLNVAEDADEPSTRSRVAVLFFADRQLPQRVEHESLLLVLPRRPSFGGEVERVLWS